MPPPWGRFHLRESHAPVLPLLNFRFKSLGEGNLSGAVCRKLCVSHISRDSLMRTCLLPCEEGTLPNMTSSQSLLCLPCSQPGVWQADSAIFLDKP